MKPCVKGSILVVYILVNILTSCESSLGIETRLSEEVQEGAISVRLPCKYKNPVEDSEPDFSIQWRRREKVLIDGDHSSNHSKYSITYEGNLVIVNITAADEDTYMCLVNWDFRDHYVTDRTFVTLKVLKLRNSFQIYAVDGDASVELPCTLTYPADVPFTLEWRMEGETILDFDGQSQTSTVGRYALTRNRNLTIHDVTTEDRGHYMCLVSWDLEDRYETQQTDVILTVTTKIATDTEHVVDEITEQQREPIKPLRRDHTPNTAPTLINTSQVKTTNTERIVNKLRGPGTGTVTPSWHLELSSDNVVDQVAGNNGQSILSNSSVFIGTVLTFSIIGLVCVAPIVGVAVYLCKNRKFPNTSIEDPTPSRKISEPDSVTELIDISADDDQEVFQSLSTLPQTSGIPATAHLPVSYSQLSIILLGGGDASAYVDNIRGRQRHNTYPPPLLRPRDDSSLRDLVNFPPGVGSIDTIDSDLTYRTDSTYPYLGGVGYVPVKSPCNACRRLRFIEKIGSGEFGEVHKATIHSSSGMTSGAVAVKTVKHPDCTSEQASLTRECEILASLLPCSKFIIAVIGYCVHPLSNAVKCIIMEFCENGNLRNYLRKHGNQSYHNRREYGPQIILTSNDLMKFACQISEGMCFLADSNCLHRDLAARNVLITRDKDCRISDFGMAKQMNTDGIYLRQSQVPLPVRWMAPESIRDHVYTLKTEVWSFGIVLWEIATFGSTPYSDIKDAYEARTKILEGHKLEKPKHCRPEIFGLMMDCCHRNPEHRPAFPEIRSSLLMMKSDGLEYINVADFDTTLYINLDLHLRHHPEIL